MIATNRRIKTTCKLLIVLNLVLIYSASFSQKNIQIFNQKTDSGYIILANNDEVFPVSISVNFDLTNLISTVTTNVFVIPASTKNNILTKLVLEESNKGYHFSFKYKSFIGDVINAKNDKNYIYELPFKKGNSFKLHQGYKGNFSHQNENALDFTMPIGTEVVAARGGIVIQIVDKNNEGCPKKSCMELNNYITILHNDGTYSKYVHLDFKGAKVKIGDTVATGQLIALSGNTGFSSGPHLHFVCYLPSVDEKITLETKFGIDDGNKSIYLQEGNIYTKNY